MNILDEITKKMEFDFSTTRFGVVKISVVTRYDIAATEDALLTLQPEAISRMLFTRLARPMEITYEDHQRVEPPPVHFDGGDLDAEEVENFAGDLSSHNKWLARDGSDDYLEQTVGESNVSYVDRVFRHHQEKQEASNARFLQPVASRVFSDLTRDSWVGSAVANGRLGASLENMRHAHLSLPKMASQVTNDHLRELSEKLDGATPVVENMAAAIIALEKTVRTMQADAVTNSARADKKTLAANCIAVVGIFLSLAALAVSVMQMRNNSLVNELQGLRSDLRSEHARRALDISPPIRRPETADRSQTPASKPSAIQKTDEQRPTGRKAPSQGSAATPR